jgi:hypothetical protein
MSNHVYSSIVKDTELYIESDTLGVVSMKY